MLGFAGSLPIRLGQGGVPAHEYLAVCHALRTAHMMSPALAILVELDAGDGDPSMTATIKAKRDPDVAVSAVFTTVGGDTWRCALDIQGFRLESPKLAVIHPTGNSGLVNPTGLSIGATGLLEFNGLVTTDTPVAGEYDFDDFTLWLYESPPTMESLGAPPDKEDRRQESEAYSYGALIDMMTGRGSAYRHVGLVKAEDQAIARMVGAMHRAAERLGGEHIPGDSVVTRSAWASAMGIARSTESAYRERRQLTARTLAHGAPASDVVTLSALAACSLERTSVIDEQADITIEVFNTYWAGGTDDPTLSLGDGSAWTSGRALRGYAIQDVAGRACQTTEAEDKLDADAVFQAIMPPTSSWLIS